MEKLSHRQYHAEKNDRMRKKMLYYGYQMGYDQPIKEGQQHLSRREICISNVSGWCESSRCAIGKPLDEMTGKELTRCLTQFEQVYKSFLKSY